MTPRMPANGCLTPLCPRDAVPGRRRCRECLKARRREKGHLEDRPNAGARGYDAQWRKVRKLKAAQDPLCEWCKRKGWAVPLAVVDHIVPIRAGGARLDLRNLQSLCDRCHGKKGREDAELYPELYQ